MSKKPEIDFNAEAEALISEYSLPSDHSLVSLGNCRDLLSKSWDLMRHLEDVPHLPGLLNRLLEIQVEVVTNALTADHRTPIKNRDIHLSFLTLGTGEGSAWKLPQQRLDLVGYADYRMTFSALITHVSQYIQHRLDAETALEDSDAERQTFRL